jgi:hypothetical protein
MAKRSTPKMAKGSKMPAQKPAPKPKPATSKPMGKY